MDWDKKISSTLFDRLTEQDFLEAVRHIEKGPWQNNEAYKEKRLEGLKLCYLIFDCFRFDEVQSYEEFEAALAEAARRVEKRNKLELPALYELSWSSLTRDDYIRVLSEIPDPEGGIGRERYWTLQMNYDVMYLMAVCSLLVPRSFSTLGTMDQVAARFHEVHTIITTRLNVSRLSTESGAE